MNSIEKDILISKKRFSFKNGIELSVSDSSKDKQAYYQIRELCYRQELGLDFFSGAEDEDDRDGEIIIIKSNDRVIGGARINFVIPKMSNLLPLEEEGFHMKLLFPDLKLNNVGYCEFGRIAILPEHRSKGLWLKLVAVLTARALSRECKYLFTISSMEQALQNQGTHIEMGCHYIIEQQMEVPQKQVYSSLGRIYLSHSQMEKDGFTAYNML